MGRNRSSGYSPAHFAGIFDDDDDDDEAVVSRLAPKLVKLQHAKDFVWEELHTGDWKDEDNTEGEGLVIFAYCRMCVRYARAHVKNDELGAKYVERVLKRVIKELDVERCSGDEAGGGKTASGVTRGSERAFERGEKDDGCECRGRREESAELRFNKRCGERDRGEDVEDDGKKRKREASEEEEEEEEEKNVLFPILEKDRGGQPPLKVPKFKEPLSLETFLTQFYLPKKPCAMRRFLHALACPREVERSLVFPRQLWRSSRASRIWKLVFERKLENKRRDVRGVSFKAHDGRQCGRLFSAANAADQFPKLLEDIREPEYVHGCFREEEEKGDNGGSKINSSSRRIFG